MLSACLERLCPLRFIHTFFIVLKMKYFSYMTVLGSFLKVLKGRERKKFFSLTFFIIESIRQMKLHIQVSKCDILVLRFSSFS